MPILLPLSSYGWRLVLASTPLDIPDSPSLMGVYSASRLPPGLLLLLWAPPGSAHRISSRAALDAWWDPRPHRRRRSWRTLHPVTDRTFTSGFRVSPAGRGSGLPSILAKRMPNLVRGPSPDEILSVVPGDLTSSYLAMSVMGS